MLGIGDCEEYDFLGKSSGDYIFGKVWSMFLGSYREFLFLFYNLFWICRYWFRVGKRLISVYNI